MRIIPLTEITINNNKNIHKTDSEILTVAGWQV